MYYYYEGLFPQQEHQNGRLCFRLGSQTSGSPKGRLNVLTPVQEIHRMISIWVCHFLNALNQTEKKLDAKIPLEDEKVWRSTIERTVFHKKQVNDLLEIEFYSSTDIIDSSTSNNGLINKLTNSHSNFVDSKLIYKQISHVNYNIANINPKMKEDYVFEDEQDLLEVVEQFGSTFLESYR